MAEAEGGLNAKNMSLSKVQPDTEWSTREKLAIASYVQRNGEQNWSGAGRFLRPLGEPGRPSDWFSPKFCAQQYTALMEQTPPPKRKRSESAENVQPVVPPEEVIINRLTNERIEELKKHVRNERMDYRKLKREIEMVENGELDDKLDELLRDVNKTDDASVEDTQPIEQSIQDTTSSQDTVPVQDNEIVKPTAAEDISVVKLENLHTESELNAGGTHDNTDIISRDESAAVDVSAPVKTEYGDTAIESSDTQPVAEVAATNTEEEVTTDKNESMETTLTASSNLVAGSAESEENVFPESALLKAEELMKGSDVVPADDSVDESVSKTSSPSHIADDPIESEPTLPISENMEVEVSGTEVKPDISEDTPTETKLENTPKIEVPASEAGQEPIDYSEKVAAEEDAKATPSLPSTPGHTGSFVYDATFPYSPALSHSSDMDPESAASMKAWRKSIMILWKQVASHRYANIFLQAVTDEIAPNYSNTVYRSTDLTSIKKNIEGGAIRSTSEFRRDVMLMFQNALMYNNAEHDVYKWTLEMQKDFIDQIAQFIATQMMVETAQTPENKSLRRSTMRRSVLSEKSNQSTRSRRSAVADADSK